MDPKQHEIVEKLQAANNILVTVSANPSVDQLSACIGLTLLLNKLNKHATAVFSGDVPSTIDFLKPENTIEKNTDSLRDFIISLDKTKADKLRYKVEDKVVKIFITPYRTSLSGDDLEFSQGDFNIDVVLALGVQQQTDLDQAITSHGRILHDATVMAVNNAAAGELGSINWLDTNASSLCELVTRITKSFDKPLLDEQIATALLTGIVAETDRFRNDKTSASTMSASADLLAAGANQQLVAHELESEVDASTDTTTGSDGDDKGGDAGATDAEDKSSEEPAPPKSVDGMLEITHPEREPEPVAEIRQPAQTTPEPLGDEPPLSPEAGQSVSDAYSRPLVMDAPKLGGHLTANTMEEDDMPDLSMGLLSGSDQNQPLLSHDQSAEPASGPSMPPSNTDGQASGALDIAPTHTRPAAEAPQQETSLPEPQASSASWSEPVQQSSQSASVPISGPIVTPGAADSFTLPATPLSAPSPTLTEREEPAVDPRADQAQEVDKAREEVMKAISGQDDGVLPPIAALNAQPVDLGNHPDTNAAAPEPLPPNLPEQAPLSESPADQALTMPLPQSLTMSPAPTTSPTDASSNDPNAPPPVPPPIMPPTWPGKQ